MRTIAIVGAGFCGTMVAVHLLRKKSSTPTSLYLVERSGRFTAGVAYGTELATHVLNVPAGRMSAFPEDPDHFLRWAIKRDDNITGGTFVPRYLYGDYLRDTLRDAAEGASRETSFACIGAEARGIREIGDRVELSLSAGGVLRADAAVLALGNYPPNDPPIAPARFFRSPRWIRDPWAPNALDIPRDEAILILGTGLTMMDIAVALRDRGHRGKIYAISRRGLRAQAHRGPHPLHAHGDPPRDIHDWPKTALGQLRAMRRHVREQAKLGLDWRESVTSIREATSALWRSLPDRERRRFLRHVRPFWETHRHRAAPATAKSIDDLCTSGQLEIQAGRIINLREDDRGLNVTVRLRARAEEVTLRVARALNCTGPDTSLSRLEDPFMRSLYEQGFLRADPLGLGVETDEVGAALDAAGRASEKLFVAGPLRKGAAWEHTAVPELRVAAGTLADRLDQIGRGS